MRSISLMDRRTFVALLVATALATSTGIAEQPKEITVFCAASLKGAFVEIGQMYRNETSINIVFDFDGSQLLRSQIENGAYSDIFVSANEKQKNLLKNGDS